MNQIRKFMTLLLLVAYIGQSLAASAVPCLVMGSANSASTSELATAGFIGQPAMTHAEHHMDGSEQADTASDNSCCDGGLCSMSLCQSVAAVPQALLCAGLAYAAVYSGLAPVSSPTHLSTFLYRPPISR